MCIIIIILLPHSWLSMVNINKKDIAYLSDYHIVCTNREGGMMTTSHHYHQYAYDMINLAIYAQKMYNVISSNSLSLYRTLFFKSFSSESARFYINFITKWFETKDISQGWNSNRSYLLWIDCITTISDTKFFSDICFIEINVKESCEQWGDETFQI